MEIEFHERIKPEDKTNQRVSPLTGRKGTWSPQSAVKEKIDPTSPRQLEDV